MSQSPAFSFYAKDFLLGTATFSLAERGAYITLMSYQWDKGGVPDDPVERARLLGCSKKEEASAWARVGQKFERGGDGLWRNPRLEIERRKQADRRAALASNGSKGGRPRKQRETNSFPHDNQNESLPSPSPSPSPTPTTQKAELSGAARPTHPARRHGLETLHRGSHRSHAWCSERICVPQFQHDKFVGAVGGPDADALLRTFYATTIEAIPWLESIESDPLKFWPPLVAARWTPHTLNPKTAWNRAAASEWLSEGT